MSDSRKEIVTVEDIALAKRILNLPPKDRDVVIRLIRSLIAEQERE